MKIIPATSLSQLQTIEALAREILPKVYSPYIPDDHIEFFLNKFQTVSSIQQQIKEGYKYYLLTDSDKNAGYLGIKANGSTILLSKLYILDEYRGKGIGAKAMSFVYEKAIAQKSATIELIVNRQNTPAIKFYEERDFKITKLLLHTFENGHSVEVYKMEKRLNL